MTKILFIGIIFICLAGCKQTICEKHPDWCSAKAFEQCVITYERQHPYENEECYCFVNDDGVVGLRCQID